MLLCRFTTVIKRAKKKPTNEIILVITFDAREGLDLHYTYTEMSNDCNLRLLLWSIIWIIFLRGR